MMFAVAQPYHTYTKYKHQTDDYQKLARINSSLALDGAFTRRFPCPADPTLSSTDPLSGVGNCTLLNCQKSAANGGGACAADLSDCMGPVLGVGVVCAP